MTTFGVVGRIQYFCLFFNKFSETFVILNRSAVLNNGPVCCNCLICEIDGDISLACDYIIRCVKVFVRW